MVRSTQGAIARYVPDVPPKDPAFLADYLLREFDKMAGVLNALADGQIDETTVAPAKPRTGMLRLADGTNWNPGAGAGLYLYQGGAWTKL